MTSKSDIMRSAFTQERSRLYNQNKVGSVAALDDARVGAVVPPARDLNTLPPEEKLREGYAMHRRGEPRPDDVDAGIGWDLRVRDNARAGRP